MSFFSDFIGVTTTATPAFTVETYKGANVGQYGWTKEDTGRYNQLIQYVEECRNILEEVSKIALSINMKSRVISTVMEEVSDLKEENRKLKAALLVLATKTGVTLEL